MTSPPPPQLGQRCIYWKSTLKPTPALRDLWLKSPLISYLVASTAASQLNLSFPTGGFFHIPLGITRIGGLGLCLLTAVWYSSIALRALHTSWEGLVKFPPKTTSFLRSQILCATVATTYISPSSILSIRVPICCGLLVWWELAPLKHHYDRVILYTT